MENNIDNILLQSKLLNSSKLLSSIYAMSSFRPYINWVNERAVFEKAKREANYLPYLAPSSPIVTLGSHANPLGLDKNIPPLPDVSSLKKLKGILPPPLSSKPVMTVDSYSYPLGLSKDMPPLPDASSKPELLQIKQNQFPEPISTEEPQKSVPPQQGVIPNQSAGSQQSFWDHLRSREFLQRLSDYGIGYALSDGTVAQSLASGAMNLRRGDLEREKSNQVNQTVEYLKSKGYSEEEARVMARNPQMLSALLTGGDVPAGFKRYTNPETGELEYRPIKGSPQELEYNQKLQAHKEWESRKRNNMFATKMHLRAGLDALKAAYDLLKEGRDNGFTRWLTQDIGGSKGYRLKKLLEGIRGSVLKTVFENLKSMSLSGAIGTGPISNFESESLSSMFGSLDVGRNKEELERTFEIIQAAFNFFNQYNELQLYNALTGQALDTPKEISDQYFVDLPRSQEDWANVPVVNKIEEVNKFPSGTKLIMKHNGEFLEIRRK